MGNNNSGRGGLPHAKRREIERLILAGRLKNAQIARECGIDVSTVSRYKRRMRERQESSTGEPPDLADRGCTRCGSCGGLLVAEATFCLRCLQEKRIFGPARRIRTNRRRAA